MKVFTCNKFHGHYPVGTAAVIVATDINAARDLLQAHLNAIGLTQPQPISTRMLEEIYTESEAVIVLNDGNY